MSRPPLLLTERLSGPHYQHNAQTLAFTRTSTSVLAGCVAGVLGLTGLYGFLFYLLSILLSAALWYYRLDFDVKVSTAPHRTTLHRIDSSRVAFTEWRVHSRVTAAFSTV